MQGMHTKGKHVFLLFLTFFLLLALSISLSILSPQARAEAVTIVQHSALGPQIPVGQSGTLTISCASGEQLLGGGFYANAFEGAVNVIDNYPSAPDTWQITVNNSAAPSWVQMTGYVYCLQAPYPIGTTIVQASRSGTETLTSVNCPAGSTLLSGGYASGGGTSVPAGNGWQSTAPNVYAVCATQSFTPGSNISHAFPIPSVAGPTASGTVQCGSGQFATGGGFDSTTEVSNSLATINANGVMTNWSITVAGTYSTQAMATVWIVCVNLPGAVSTPTVSPTPSISAHVVYQLNSQWQGGLSAALTITNTGTQTINGWTLQFTFPVDQHITQWWNGNVTQAQAQVTITNASYNGTINPGQKVTLGFNGTWTANDANPTAFTLNGFPTS